MQGKSIKFMGHSCSGGWSGSCRPPPVDIGETARMWDQETFRVIWHRGPQCPTATLLSFRRAVGAHSEGLHPAPSSIAGAVREQNRSSRHSVLRSASDDRLGDNLRKWGEQKKAQHARSFFGGFTHPWRSGLKSSGWVQGAIRIAACSHDWMGWKNPRKNCCTQQRARKNQRGGAKVA